MTSAAARAGIATDTAAVLVDSLLAPAAGADVGTGVASVRDLWSRDARLAIGHLVVPVSGLAGLLDALDADARSEPVPVVLRADTGLVEAGEARSILLDDDRVELVGLQVRLPDDGPLGEAAGVLLTTLDFALTAWIDLPPAPGLGDALDVLADDGAERALLDDPARDLDATAAFVVACVRRGLGFGLGAGVAPLAALAATAAALDAREPAHVAALLRAGTEPQLAVVADADARALRRLLVSVGCLDADACARELASLGLLPDDGST